MNYKDIFSPETMKSLDAKSKESLRSLLGNKNLIQTITRSSQLLPEIIEAEAPYKEKLENLAANIIRKLYPVVGYNNIEIKAEIVGMGQINLPNDQEEEEPQEGDPEEEMLAKRRIKNGITQGASVRGGYGFVMYKKLLDSLDPSLIEKYKEILNLSFGIYDNEEAIALMLAMLAQNQKIEGGSSDIEFENDEENPHFVIKAKAVCFPMLVHEIVKGLMEIIGTEGFTRDKEKNKAIINKVDKLKNEPLDIRYGKFIYDALNQLYIDSESDDPRIRELLLASIYNLPDNEFVGFIENMINGRLTNDQKLFVKSEIRDIESDLKQDDSGLD